LQVRFAPQDTHAPPALPQAVLLVPVLHVLPEQHPVVHDDWHDVAMHVPPEQMLPVPQFWHAPPPAPHWETDVPVTH
jgi:hypothetical protein